jgi:hypothetical protein
MKCLGAKTFQSKINLIFIGGPLQDSGENILVPKLHLMPQTDTKDRSYKDFYALKSCLVNKLTACKAVKMQTT